MDTTDLYHDTAHAQLAREGEPERYGDPEEGGDLLSMPEDRVAGALTARWDSQTQILKPQIAQWAVNALRRKGIPGVRLKGGEEGAIHVPKHAASADAVPALNKLADTIRRLVSLLFSDPPASQAIPHSDSDVDKDAAEFATQVLEEIDGESELDDVLNAELAFDRGADYGSGFVFYWVDKRGGSRVPIRIQAGFDNQTGRRAEHVQDAEYDPAYPGMGIEWGDYMPRYVRTDGSLTDEQREAATRWAPKIRAKVLRATNVRLLPFTAKDVWDADGVILTDFPTWQEAKRDHPELLDLSAEELDALLGARPSDYKDVMTAAERRAVSAKSKEDRPVWRIRCFYRQCPDYPKGAHLVVLGGKHLVTREPWMVQRDDGIEEAIDLPLTQYAHLDEGGRGGAYRVGMTEILGGANEMRTYIWSMVVHQLERIRNQKTLLPSLGKLHAKMLQRPGKNILPFQPGYKPEYEQIPDLPGLVMDAFERISLEIDDASGVQAAARGLEQSNVQSGRHHYAIMSQVKQGLASLIRNIERGWTRAGRIKLQLIRKEYTAEQQLLWSGDDDEWKQKAWKRADLGSTRDIRLKAGTLTMYSPAQKEMLAFEWHGAGLIDNQRLYEIVASNMGATIGVQQDNRRSRIKRQLNRWSEGPPDDWQPPQMRMQPRKTVDPVYQIEVEERDPYGEVAQEPVLDPGGRPMYEPDPLLQKLFEPVPSDLVPRTAQIRFDMICEVMNGKKYLEMHPAWRAGLDAEFYRMDQAVQAGAPPPASAGGKAPEVPPAATFADAAVAPPSRGP